MKSLVGLFLHEFIPSFPTGPFIISESQDQENGELYEVQERHATNFEATNLREGRPGCHVVTS